MGGAGMTGGLALFTSGGGRSLFCMGVFSGRFGLWSEIRTRLTCRRTGGRAPDGSVASTAPSAAEVVEKMAGGGRRARGRCQAAFLLLQGQGRTLSNGGTALSLGRACSRWRPTTCKPFHDIQGERMRLDYRNGIFSGFVNEVSELVLADAGYVHRQGRRLPAGERLGDGVGPPVFDG